MKGFEAGSFELLDERNGFEAGLSNDNLRSEPIAIPPTPLLLLSAPIAVPVTPLLLLLEEKKELSLTR